MTAALDFLARIPWTALVLLAICLFFAHVEFQCRIERRRDEREFSSISESEKTRDALRPRDRSRLGTVR